MPESRTGSRTGKNPTLPDASDSLRRIRAGESDAFVARLREVIGEGSTSSFSRKCGVGESTIRNVLDGAFPRADNLVAFADAGEVTVDWLATGRLPKLRKDLNDAMTRVSEPAGAGYAAVDLNRLQLALTMAEDAADAIGEPLSSERRAELALKFYQRLGDSRGSK